MGAALGYSRARPVARNEYWFDAEAEWRLI